METLEQLKEIESNQPEDGTAQIYDGEYWKQDGNLVFYVWSNVRGSYEWVPDAPKDLYNLRSLSDIKLIIELMELNQNMHTTVAGYLWGKDWAHWNEFNAGKFKL